MKYKPVDLRRVILREPCEETDAAAAQEAESEQSDRENNAPAVLKPVAVSFSQDPEIFKILHWVGLHFIRYVVGDHTYQEKVGQYVDFWEWATDSDLAFALMALDVYYDEAKREMGGGKRKGGVGRRKGEGEVNIKGTAVRARYVDYKRALKENMKDETGDMEDFTRKYNEAFKTPAYENLHGKTVGDDTNDEPGESEEEGLSELLDVSGFF